MNGVGIKTANVRTGILDAVGIATFRSNTRWIITLSPDGHAFALVLQQFKDKSLVSQLTTSFHSYSIIIQTYHAMTIMDSLPCSRCCYSTPIAGVWYELVNKTLDHTVGVNREVPRWYDNPTDIVGGNTDEDSLHLWVEETIVTTTSHSEHQIKSSDDPTIYLARGQTYQFDMSASGHPFYIQQVQKFTPSNVLIV